MIVVLLISIGLIVGFGMHFLLPARFSKLIIDIVGAIAGAVIGAVISTPFSTPGSIGQKITFLLASIAGSAISVLIARALKI